MTFSRSNFLSTGATLAIAAVPCFLAFAALGKVLDNPTFAESLETYTLLTSERARRLSLVVVPIVECVPLALLIGRRYRAACVASAIIVLGLTGVVVAHWSMNVRPTCACMGLWNRYWRVESDAKSLLIRNSILVSISIIGAVVASRRTSCGAVLPSSASPGGRDASAENAANARAFSLIETMIVIAIIAVLVSLSLAWLASAKNAGRRTASLSNLHTHAQSFTAYAGDHKDAWPLFTHPGRGERYPVPEGGRVGVTVVALAYFDMSRAWHLFMAAPYYNTAFNAAVFRPPGIPDGRDLEETGWPIYTSYAMPCAFFADPTFWNEYTRSTARSQLRGTRLGEVSFPTAKMLVVQTWAPPLRSGVGGEGTGEALARGPNLAAFCDGSARSVNPTDRMSGYDKGDGMEFIEDGAIHFTDAPPLLHTYDGVRGRDFR